MSFAIHGLGIAHPPDAVTAAEGLALARKLAGPDVRTSTWLGPIYTNSGVNTRYQVIGGPVVRDVLNGTNESNSPFVPTAANDGVGPTTGERMAIYAKEAGPLALRASAAALTDAGFAPETITHLITVSCTGFAAPGVDYALIAGLGLKQTVARTHIGFMGCQGALNGLRVANAYACSDPSARVLLCAVELPSLHYYYGSAADKLIANAIFADGAAAVVGQANPARKGGGDTTNPRPCGRGSLEYTLASSGSCQIPDSSEDMCWVIGDHGFEMSLSRRVPGFIARHLRQWLISWLGDNGLSLAEVRSWAVHPGGPKIVSAVEGSLALAAESLAASRAVFAEFGNMSSPTVLFILRRLQAENAPRPCVALGFGPGLVAEAALFV